MKILVDTCVWSAALRRKNPVLELTIKLRDFIKDGLVIIIGPIRQELLSGVSNEAQFKWLKEYLSFFEDIPLKTDHFVKAAEFCNICKSNGINGTTIDFLICAVAYLEQFIVYTTDNDFTRYIKHLPIKLLKY